MTIGFASGFTSDWLHQLLAVWRFVQRRRAGVRSWLALLMPLCLFAPVSGHAESAMTAGAPVLEVKVGGQQAFNLPGGIIRLAVGNPALAGIRLVTREQALITGKAAGETTLQIWQRGKDNPEVYPLKVYPTGIAHSNVQVQTDIRVVEVSKNALHSAGFFFGKNTGNTTFAIGQGALSGVDVGDSGAFTLQSSAGFLSDSSAFNIIGGSASRGLLATISALSTNGYAYTLAEPSLVTLSGQQAFFLAGGEFPFPKSNNNGDISVDFKEFGVRLSLTPTVMDDDRILLKVAPEVSELDFLDGLQASGVSVPALKVRRTDTTVQLGDGESFVISGLVSRNTLKNAQKLPLLGDLPIIGAFFRSTQFESNDKELMMVVTPHLVRPFARRAPLPELPGEVYRTFQPSFFRLVFLDEEPGDRTSMPSGMGFSEAGSQ
ncbi:type II and III secretion system protein family protein [Pokkaliibacter sp. CJK22405]|uniref:type II and III secretion system protein family protein n=1 Tax=Pokkaliibacter sp. CJK22405 TaxID=3384615 RepID=UPI0039846B44